MENKIVDALVKYFPDHNDRHAISARLNEVVRKISSCRTVELGGHLYGCPDHHTYSFLYNSCKQRGCPICMELRKLQWIEKKMEMLLPVEHNHLVYKLPSQLSLLWLRNKEKIADILFDAVSETYAKLRKKDGITRGISNVLHTAGRNLSYHPHMHSLVTIEGKTADNEWKKEYLNKTELEKEYRVAVKKKLIDSLNSGEVQAPTDDKDYIRLIEKLADREWDIFQSEIYENGEGVIKYCANHIRGMAVDEKDIKQLTDEYVEIEHSYEGKKENIVLSTQEFVIRYLNHIPPKGLVLVRNLGLYSTRHIKETMKRKMELEQKQGVIAPKKTYESVSIKCPICGKEFVMIKSFTGYELKKAIKQYLIDGSPPGYGEIFENKEDAA